MNEIKTVADLREHLDDQDREITLLKKQLLSARKGLATAGILPETKQYIDMESMGAMFAHAAGYKSEKVVRLVSEMQEKATLGTPLVIDSGTGVYLVPEEYIQDISAILQENSETYRVINKLPLSSNSAKYPVHATGVTLTRVTTDSAALTESSPTFSEIDLDVETFATFVSITENFDDDSLVIIGDYMRRLMRDAWVTSIETNVLNNASNPTGILQNASVNVYRLAGSSYEDLDYDDLYGMIETLTTQLKRQGAVFFMNPIVWDTCSKLVDANGNPLITPSMNVAAPKMIAGHRVILSDAMPSTDGGDLPFIAFGNPDYLVMGERKALEFKYYGNTEKAVQHMEVFFRMVYRAAFACVQPAAFSVLKTSA